MFLHDESIVNSDKNRCVLQEYVREVVGRGGGAFYDDDYYILPNTSLSIC